MAVTTTTAVGTPACASWGTSLCCCWRCTCPCRCRDRNAYPIPITIPWITPIPIMPIPIMPMPIRPIPYTPPPIRDKIPAVDFDLDRGFNLDGVVG